MDKIHANKKDAPHPLLLTFEFHERFLTIHPFADGNGRTARLLHNLLLVSLGYPPVWVSDGAEKDAYNRYLGDIQSYGGSPDLLYTFMAGLVERSLQIMLDVLEGRDIEDIDDWKKAVLLFKNEQPQADAIQVLRSTESIQSVFRHSIKPAVESLLYELKIYDDLFLKKQCWYSLDGGAYAIDSPGASDVSTLLHEHTSDIGFHYSLEGFKKPAEKPFAILCSVF